MRPTPTWIAETRVVIVHPDGRRVPGYIRVGQPYTLGGELGSGELGSGEPARNNYESHCPIEIDSIYPPGCPAIGAGTLSALLNGLQVLGVILHSFIEQGGRVLDADDGADLRLDWLFGPLLRSPEPPVNDASP